jgi:hypothetical protein
MNLRERWHRTHIKFGVISVLLDKPERWRRRAKEARTIAKAMKDLQAQRTMVEIAYDQLAERPAQRAKKSG